MGAGRKFYSLPRPHGPHCCVGYAERVKPQRNKERPLNVGGRIWKRFLNLEIYRHKEGSRYKNREGSKRHPMFKEEQAKGKWLKDTFTKTEDPESCQLSAL